MIYDMDTLVARLKDEYKDELQLTDAPAFDRGRLAGQIDVVRFIEALMRDDEPHKTDEGITHVDY